MPEKLKGLLDSPEARKKAGLRKGAYDSLLSAFLSANVLVGLRPSEWEHASLVTPWEGAEAALLVRNWKTTNGRGNGEGRLLVLSPEAVQRLPTLPRHWHQITAANCAP